MFGWGFASQKDNGYEQKMQGSFITDSNYSMFWRATQVFYSSERAFLKLKKTT